GLNERIGYMQDLIERSPDALTERETSDRAFHRVQALVRARMADPEAVLAHYRNIPEANRTCMDHLGLGLVYERMRNMSKAASELQAAAACAPNDPGVNRELGRFLFERGEYQKAGRYLQKAVILNPDDVIAMYAYARLLTEIGQKRSALDFYRRVVQAKPKDAKIRYHYGRVLGAAGRYFEAHLQLAYGEMYDNDLKKARFHMDKAASLVSTEEQKKELEELRELFEERT
ncbi:MAG: tetratricopeptide repeat protein, partial [Desulfovibrionaceae bacterium]